MISTPWLDSGFFYDTDIHGGDDVLRVVVTIDDLIAEGVPGSVEAKQRYLDRFGGEDSPEYRSRALAQYISSNPFGEMRSDAVDQCMAFDPRFEGLKVASLDSARSDDPDRDECAAAFAQGYDVIEMDAWRSRNLVYTTNRFSLKAREFGAELLRPDANGIGAGPTDMLVDDGWDEDQVEEIIAQARAAEPDRFVNRSTEIMYHFAQRVNNLQCAIPQDQVLRGQCLQIMFKPMKGGKLALVKKPKIKGKKTRSPDRLEACAMATTDSIPGKCDGLLGVLKELNSGSKQARAA